MGESFIDKGEQLIMKRTPTRKLNVSKRSGLVSYTELRAIKSNQPSTNERMSKDISSKDLAKGPNRISLTPKKEQNIPNQEANFPFIYPFIIKKTVELRDKIAPKQELNREEKIKPEKQTSGQINCEKNTEELGIRSVENAGRIILTSHQEKEFQRKFPFYPDSVEEIQSICEIIRLPPPVPLSHKENSLNIQKSSDEKIDMEEIYETRSELGLPKRMISSILQIKTPLRNCDNLASPSTPKLSSVISFLLKERVALQKSLNCTTSESLKDFKGIPTPTPNERQKLIEDVKSLPPLPPSPPFQMTNLNEDLLPPIQQTTNNKIEEGKATKWNKILNIILHLIFSHIGVLLLLFCYTIIGALIFKAIEGPLEKETQKEVQNFRKLTALDLAVQIKVIGINNMDLEYVIEKTMKQYQDRIIGFVEHGFDGQEDRENKKWSFAGAILYCVTVITTIGYGKTAPISNLGRMLTVFYAILGIPVLVLFLGNFGALLAVTFKWLCKWISVNSRCAEIKTKLFKGDFLGLLKMGKRYRYYLTPAFNNLWSRSADEGRKGSDNIQKYQFPRLNQNNNNSNDTTRDEDLEEGSKENEGTIEEILNSATYRDYQVPVWACLSLMFGYLILGSLSFSFWEGWDAITSFYFCFITLSTIGFGDIVPGTDLLSASAIEKLVFVSFYILFGMALMSMCFNLMQQNLIKTVKKWGSRLGFF